MIFPICNRFFTYKKYLVFLTIEVALNHFKLEKKVERKVGIEQLLPSILRILNLNLKVDLFPWDEIIAVITLSIKYFYKVI